MEELLDMIIEATVEVYGIGTERLCSVTRDRDVVCARRAASWVCRKEGLPARMLAQRFKVSRWCVNRMQSEAGKSTSEWFKQKTNEISTIIARKHKKS